MTRQIGKSKPDNESARLLAADAQSCEYGHVITNLLILAPIAIFLLIFFTTTTANCQSTRATTSKNQVVDGVIEIRIPDGFKSEGVDEPHIFKWTKNSADIYIVVGDRLTGSRSAMIGALKKAANADSRLQQVRIMKISNAKAILTKEKAQSDTNRLLCWGLKILTEKNEINVEFSAPAKDFNSYSSVFEECVKSIRIKSSKG